MASDEMVSKLISELRQFAEFLDEQLQNVLLCMAYQTESAADTKSWTFCVCADDLDDKSDRAAIALVSNWMEARVSRASLNMIERVVVLRAYDPDAQEILSAIRTPDQSYLLSGYPVYGRVIAHAEVFIIRPNIQGAHQPHTVRV